MSTAKDDAPADAENATPPAPAKRKKALILGGAGAAVLLLGGGGAYAMLGGKSAAKDEAKTEHAAPAKAEGEHGGGEGGEGGEGGHGGGENVPLDVPPILVNLRSPDGAAHFLKLHIMLVAGPSTTFDDLKKKLPILMDAYQPFLRELRPEDLSGSASIYRIKEELMLRSAQAVGSGQVQDVLVQDLIQQ